MDDDLLGKLYEADKVPLFSGATVSLLGALLVVLTICKTHGVSNACVDELMKALSNPSAPSSSMFNTCMAPLVDELLTLWNPESRCMTH
jgi:hypothetical protein